MEEVIGMIQHLVSSLSTASGALASMTIIWTSLTDLATSTEITNAQVRVTPYDGASSGTVRTASNFILDLKDPGAPGNVASTTVSTTQALFTWTTSTEANIDHYEVWYGTNQSDVENRTGTAIEMMLPLGQVIQLQQW